MTLRLLGPDVKKLKEKRDLAGLVKLLADSDTAVQKEAATALDELGLPNDPTAQAWHALVKRDWRKLAEVGDATIDVLAVALKGKDLDLKERGLAVAVLGEIGGVRAAEVLGQVLREKDPNMRQCAQAALYGIGDAATQVLAGALKGKDPEVKFGAGVALKMIGGVHAAEAFAECLKDPEMQTFATAALLDMGLPGANAVVALLTQKDRELTKLAVRILRGIGEPAVDPLVQVLKRMDQDKLVGACSALDGIGSPAVERLIGLLDDGPPLLRALVARTLGLIGDGRAVGPLAKVLNDTSYQPPRSSSKVSEREMYEVVFGVSDNVNVVVVHALKEIGKPAIEVLRAASNEHEDPMVRSAAKLALIDFEIKATKE